MAVLSQQIKVAFIGLGVMGYPMAGHLQQRGYQVTVYNRTASKAQDWVAQYGGNAAQTPAQAAAGADVVMLCVGNDQDVRSVVYGDSGVLASMQPGAVLVDHTTASADLARNSLPQHATANWVFWMHLSLAARPVPRMVN